MRYVLGIDPGLSGALAFYDTMLETLETIEMPTIVAGAKSKSGKHKRILDITELSRIIDSRSKDIQKVVIEKVHAIPGKMMSSVSSFNFGENFGIIKGIIAANFLPVEMVPPQTWKKALRAPAAKDGARLRATQIFPQYAAQWNKVKWDGRAEAAMIAYYGATFLK